jgi:hypothetical protein
MTKNMSPFKVFIIFLVSISQFYSIAYGQTFSRSNYWSISAGIGTGKIQYYDNFTPTFVSGSTNEDVKYSPSWEIGISRTWPLKESFDFSLGINHLTITERNPNALIPSWDEFGEEKLVQGFFHFVPAIVLNFKDYRYLIHAGMRIGTANPIGASRARTSSNAIWNMDFALDTGISYRFLNRYFIEVTWVEGMTYYDYIKGNVMGSGDVYYSFFKYRTFLVGFSYSFHDFD